MPVSLGDFSLSWRCAGCMSLPQHARPRNNFVSLQGLLSPQSKGFSQQGMQDKKYDSHLAENQGSESLWDSYLWSHSKWQNHAPNEELQILASTQAQEPGTPFFWGELHIACARALYFVQSCFNLNQYYLPLNIRSFSIKIWISDFLGKIQRSDLGRQ